MSMDELRALTQQFADAFDQRDLKPAIEMLAEDVEVFEHVRRQADVCQACQRSLSGPRLDELRLAEDVAAVFEFLSVELAKAWYNSPAYRAIIHHRQQGARYVGLLMEGGLPPVELRMPHTRTRKTHKA